MSSGTSAVQSKGSLFWFRNKEPFDWTGEVLEDDGEFQGLLGEEALFPDISSELLGVVLKDELMGPTAYLEGEP